MRLYNGCPDDELKAIWDHRDRLKAEARRLGYLLTWYPAEWKWGAGYGSGRPKAYQPIGPLCSSIDEAMRYIREDLARAGEEIVHA